jgi:microcystin-dependent protein
LLPLSQNTALFSLLGTTYGGDGKSTFALPDLEGRAPMHPGQGPGLSLHDLGETGGSETVTLLESEIPAHSHGLMATTQTANQATPGDNDFARVTGFQPYFPPSGAPLVNLSFNSLPPAGGDQPHNNMMPYLTFYFCIALQGVFPPRT